MTRLARLVVPGLPHHVAQRLNYGYCHRNSKSGSYLEREIDYLTTQKGYKWVNQWSLKPPSGN